MPLSPYVASMRARIGTDRLLLPSVTGIIFNEDDEILLVRHGDTGRWTTPGGAIEPDETPADAVAREVWEETGLRVRIERIIGVFGGPEFVVRYANGDEAQFVGTLFECQVIDGQMRPDGVETVELRYVGQAEIEELDVMPWLPDLLEHVYRRDPATLFSPPTWQPPAASPLDSSEPA